MSAIHHLAVVWLAVASITGCQGEMTFVRSCNVRATGEDWGLYMPNEDGVLPWDQADMKCRASPGFTLPPKELFADCTKGLLGTSLYPSAQTWEDRKVTATWDPLYGRAWLAHLEVSTGGRWQDTYNASLSLPYVCAKREAKCDHPGYTFVPEFRSCLTVKTAPPRWLVSWYEAARACATESARLVQINNAAQDHKLTQLLTTPSGGIHQAWLGLFKFSGGNGWQWKGYEGLGVQYTAWRSGQAPSGTGCAMKTTSGDWVKRPCQTNPAVIVCQRYPVKQVHNVHYCDTGIVFSAVERTPMRWEDARLFCKSNLRGDLPDDTDYSCLQAALKEFDWASTMLNKLTTGNRVTTHSQSRLQPGRFSLTQKTYFICQSDKLDCKYNLQQYSVVKRACLLLHTPTLPVTMAEAQKRCKRFSSELTTIEGPDEDYAVSRLFPNPRPLWLGMVIRSGRLIKYGSNQALTYSNFAHRPGTSSTDQYVRKASSLRWDVSNKEASAFLCMGPSAEALASTERSTYVCGTVTYISPQRQFVDFDAARAECKRIDRMYDLPAGRGDSCISDALRKFGLRSTMTRAEQSGKVLLQFVDGVTRYVEKRFAQYYLCRKL